MANERAHDVALAESESRGEHTAQLNQPAESGVPVEPAVEFDQPPTAPKPTRRRRICAIVVLVLACVISALSLLVLYGSWHDDRDIDNHLGQTDADVLSVAFNRTAVRFVTPDGTVNIPPEGVLYPAGLAAGERVKVEYDTLDPNLVRVAGRSYLLALLPIGSTVAGTWVIAGPLLWWLRRQSRTQATATAQPEA